MHEPIVKNLKVFPTILTTLYVVLSIIIFYLKHDIDVLIHKIKAFAIHFCIKTLETSYPVMGKITGNLKF